MTQHSHRVLTLEKEMRIQILIPAHYITKEDTPLTSMSTSESCWKNIELAKRRK